MIIDDQITNNLTQLYTSNNKDIHDIIKKLEKKLNIFYVNCPTFIFRNKLYNVGTTYINFDLLNYFNNDNYYIIHSIFYGAVNLLNYDKNMRLIVIDKSDPNYNYIKTKLRKDKLKILNE
jgi:hypothetical protein